MKSLIDTVGRYVKQRVRSSVFGTTDDNGWSNYIPAAQGRLDYETEVTDGVYSDIAMASVKWLMRVFPEPPLILERQTSDGFEPVENHPLISRIATPNSGYEGELLMVASALSFALDGNAYWRVLPSNNGGVAEIWWIPHNMIAPKGDARNYLTHYQYSPPERESINLPINEVVHFRFGLDPHDVRKGLSPLAAVLREIYTDREASEWIAGLMGGSGLPWAILSPDPQADVQNIADDLGATRAYIEQQLRSGKPGGVLALGAPVKLTPVTFTPEQMNFKEVRRIPEERISANLGIPPIVAGLGAGLDRATYANFKEAERIAYASNLIPTYKTFARTIKRNLLPLYEDNVGDFNLRFDLSEIEALQENEDDKATRVRKDLAAGLITLAEARAERGLASDDAMRVFFLPKNTAPVAADSLGDVQTEDVTAEENPDETPKADTSEVLKPATSNETLLGGESELEEYLKSFYSEN